MKIIHSFLVLLQLPTSNRRFISHGYSAAEAAGLRGAALSAGQLALPCPTALKKGSTPSSSSQNLNLFSPTI